MQDGNTITVPTDVVYYPTEISLKDDMSFNFIRTYNPIKVHNVNYESGHIFHIEGESECFYGNWISARLGDWATEYGLTPNAIYYIATKCYVIYVNHPPVGFGILPLTTDGDNMGYTPKSSVRTFQAINLNKDISVLITGINFIGYNKNKEPLNIIYPHLTTPLLWNFTLAENGWE